MVDLKDTSPALIKLLKDAGDKWGPMGVVEAVAQLWPSTAALVQDQMKSTMPPADNPSANDDLSFIPGFEGPFESAFSQELAALMNKYSGESISNTPDFLMRDFVCRAMQAANELISARDNWYGIKPRVAYKNEQGNTVVEFDE